MLQAQKRQQEIRQISNKIKTSLQTLKVKNKKFAYLISLAIVTSSFNLGYTAVCLSFLEDYIKLANHAQDNFYLSIASSAYPVGALIGATFYQKLIDKFGDSKLMIIADVFMILGYILQMYSLQIQYLLIGRLISGIFIGINLGIIPSYLISIAPYGMSGIIGSIQQLACVIGVLMSYIMALSLPKAEHSTKINIIGFLIIPIICCLIRIFSIKMYFPFDKLETHLQRGQNEIVRQYLDIFYEKASFEDFKSLKITEERQSRLSYGAPQNLVDKKKFWINERKRKRIVTVFIISNQLCGINTIFFYTKQIFDQASNGNQSKSSMLSLLLGAMQVILTLISGLLLDRYGRRSLTLFGMSIVCLNLYIAFYGNLIGSQFLLLIGIFGHVFGFSLSLGPITLIYAAQLLQNLTSPLILIWCQTIGIALFSNVIIAKIGIGNLFFCFGLITTGCLIYLMKNMKQTKGLTKNQIVNQFYETGGQSQRKYEPNQDKQKYIFSNENKQTQKALKQKMLNFEESSGIELNQIKK